MLEKEQKQLKDFTILIAEDEQFSYQYIEILLKDKVKRIDRATNGKEAVELALKNSYNLILMDLKMPVMNGIEATKILKQQFPDIPIIAQTAYSFPEEIESALKAGCTDFLSKPFKKKELIEMINRICVKSYESTTSSKLTL
jgi:CheY-like chemotaxis protein